MRLPSNEPGQRTVAGPAAVEGVGLFTGRNARAVILPAPADAGITFRRVDLPGRPEAPARVQHLVERARRTALRAPRTEVGPSDNQPPAVIETIEHCLSALAGLGIDNAVVEVDAEELPIGDGSATPYVEAILRAGIEDLEAPRRPLIVTEPVTVHAPTGPQDGVITALPSEEPVLDLVYDLDFGRSASLRRQAAAFTLALGAPPRAPAHAGVNGAASQNGTDRAWIDPSGYIDAIAPARSFALWSEAEAMRSRGLFAHLTPRDMLVIGDDGPIENTYRFEDEPARHKLLDLLGDLALVGRPVQGRVIASRSGHALNHLLARALLDQVRRRERSIDDDGPKPVLDATEILRLLPHRYPMVLVDRVISIDGDRRAVGIKNVTINEPFFQGHYPDTPIMPGVLIVEAMSQLAGLMLSQKLERTGKIAMLLSMDSVKLRRKVSPGDQLVLETEAIKATERSGDVQCRARVDGRLVAEARVRFMMVDAEAHR